MAMELVSFGIQKLWDLLSQEYEKFEGVDDQVIELKRELNLLSSFLKDADAKKHTSAVVRNCVEEIKEIVYDTEDVIETYILKEELGKTSGTKKNIRRVACIVSDSRENALDIGGIRKRISNVIRDMQSFGVQQIIADGGYMQPVHDRLREMRQTFPRDYESDLVGLEESVQKLVGYLVEEDNIQVVSITGMGGVGKTTLARQIFNHWMVKHKFNGIAWVCISQEFTRMHVWQAILQNLRPREEKDGILQMTEPMLQGELFRLLETSKSLIVLDDIWKEEDWDRIKPIFPPGKGWKVLLTSRNESVAVRGDPTYINFKPQCLTVEESWKLFQRIAFPRKDLSEFKVDKEMEEMGKEMINHCGGLPLAVKVLGGLLAAKYTLHDWKRLSENIRSHIVGRTDFNDSNNNSVYYVLSLSFEELPIYLKHCYLYLAHFPEDYPINVEKLSYYWAAEGIPKPRYYDGATIRDVADGYIEELVRRNVVIAERDVRNLRFETFHLHDMMREVCLSKAKEENFLQIAVISSLTAHSRSPCRSRRLVFQHPTELHVPTKLHVRRDINNPKLRSLLLMSDISFNHSKVMQGRRCRISGLSFTRLQLLRLLDLSRSKFEGGELPSSIGKLIHLRYLSLENSMVSHLPYSLRNLKLLIYLNLDVIWDSVIYMPKFLTGMRELRYLALPWALLKKTKLDLSNLVNLETLKNFLTRNCSFGDLHGMAKFKTLEISFYHGMSVETLSSSIGGLRDLENLTIIDHRANRFDANIRKGFVLDCNHLNKLDLKIYMPKLPDERHFPSRIKTITLTECGLEEDPMPILEKLLQLTELHLSSQSFCGKKMVCSGDGFPQLQLLSFFQLQEWEEWIVEEGSIPLLHNLTINGCPKLKELPYGMRYITSLKQLYIANMQTGWKEKLSEGGTDYYKVQHIPSVYLQRC